jgi:hypothetical protein
MAAGFPQPGIIGNPGFKGRPNVPAYFPVGGGAYGGGKGGYQLAPGGFPRRKRLLESEATPAESAPVPPPPGGAAYLPTGPTINRPQMYINPYAGIPGFEDYQHDLLKIRGDVIGKEGIRNYPAARGFPSRDRVTQISEAMQRLGLAQPPRHAMGTGVGLSPGDDMLRRLLRERLYGEAPKGVM